MTTRSSGSVLERPAQMIRLLADRGVGSEAIDRDGKAVRGFSVITRGEALGHGFWIDETFLDAVVDAGNGRTGGVKSRFTHPGLSGDGMGKQLGRARQFRRDGDQVRADLEFVDAAFTSPEGNLAGYVMDLAEDDPELFGTSIVYEPDFGAEARFKADHSDADGAFCSPDPLNKKNLMHARLSKLRAVDVVDEPAANEGGFLSFPTGSEVPALAERAVEYVLGLTAEAPPASLLGFHPERVRDFVANFAARRGLTLTVPESGGVIAMADKRSEQGEGGDKAEALAAEAAETARQAEHERFAELSAAFPDDPKYAGRAFAEGWSVEQAKANYLDRLREQKTELNQRLEQLEAEKAAAAVKAAKAEKADADGAEGVPFGGEGAAAGGGDFMDRAQALADEKDISLGNAVTQLAHKDPEAHRRYVEGLTPIRRSRD